MEQLPKEDSFEEKVAEVRELIAEGWKIKRGKNEYNEFREDQLWHITLEKDDAAQEFALEKPFPDTFKL